MNNKERRRWIKVLFDSRHSPGLANPRVQFITSRETIRELVQDIRRTELRQRRIS